MNEKNNIYSVILNKSFIKLAVHIPWYNLKQVAFKDLTQSLFSLAHIINYKYKYININSSIFRPPCWYR
jgi:hypothetical protein